MSSVESQTSVLIRKEPCPECRKHGGDRSGNNLARYSDGHAFCFACGYLEKGDGEEVTPSYKPKPSNLLDIDYRPLKARGITQETAQLYGYGISKVGDKPCHVAPYYDKNGDLVGQHLRFEGKEFRWLGQSKEVQLFGQRLWRTGGKKVVITEGEIDCLSVSQIEGNKWPVVSLPNGAKSAVKSITDNLEWVCGFEEVVLMFDEDEPGQEAAQAVSQILPIGKAFIAHLPMKDANECLMAKRGEAVITAIWNAQPWRPDGIRSGKELWEELIKPPKQGYDIPYSILNDKLKGFRKGELYLFTAGSGIGKSTIVNEIAYHLKMAHGLSLGIMSLEESPVRNARRYLGIYLNKPIWTPQGYSSVSQEDMRKAFDAVMGDGKWWIYDHFGSTNIDGLLAKIRYMITGLGCDVIVIDHISIIVSGLDDLGSDERKTIDILMTKLRSLVEETGVMVLAVVHLKRPDKGKSYGEGRQVSLTDLRGSGSLEQLSDVVIALERDQQNEDAKEANVSHIRILKNRPYGVVGEAGAAAYDTETGRLTEYSPFEKGDEETQKTDEEEIF